MSLAFHAGMTSPSGERGTALRRRWILAGTLVGLALGSSGWLLRPAPASGAQGSAYAQALLFEHVVKAIREHYVDSIAESDLYFKATQGVIENLRDPYTVLLTKDDFRRQREDLSAVHIGVGVQLGVRAGWPTVIAPDAGSPAERDGIAAGDRIVAINDTSTKGWNIQRTTNALRGDAGTPVALVVRRAGMTRPLAFQLTREPIREPAVARGTLFGDNIGYVSFKHITRNSAAEVERAIRSLQSKGMRGLVLDLRSNPGGLVNQGVHVAELFLDSTQLIGRLRGRTAKQTRAFVAARAQAWPDLPVVLLVNNGTASSAELIAAALQDHDRAVVMGTPTFGKGVAQSTIPIGKEIAIKLTTARWYTPSGRSIHRSPRSTSQLLAARPGIFRSARGRPLESGAGVVPDVLVPQDAVSDAERALLQEIGGSLSRYREAVRSFALHVKTTNAVRGEAIAVTPRMRAKLLQRLQGEGIAVSPRTFADASAAVDRELGEEIARQMFGEIGVFEYRARADRQLQRALDLLRQADTPRRAIELASAPPAR